MSSEAHSDLPLAEPKLAGRRRFTLALSIILALLLGFSISTVISSGKIAEQKYLLKISGTVTLDEAELRAVAAESQEIIYWAGALQGYSYSLTIGTSGSAIVRYIPDSATAQSDSISQRAIATYPSAQAWDKSLIAAGRAGVTSFRNPDGSLVFYDGKESTSIFMAFPEQDIQVEIFDARIGQALNLALLVGQIQRIEAEKNG